MPISDLREKYETAGQGHVFDHFESLTDEQKDTLTDQLSQIDLDELDRLVQKHVLGTGGPEDATPAEFEPASYIPLPHSGGDPEPWERAAVAGEGALRAGRVAAFTVAGGQGTRLGFDGPKGAYEVTPVTGKSLFQVFAEKILAASRRYDRPIPWFIMTSVINHGATVKFFEKHRFFGFDRELVHFFSQGLMPAVDFDGKIILSAPGEIALSPDGHGGSLRALVRNGCTETMRQRGIDILSYFQVDNPLVRCLDPAFIGFHVLGESELSSKACLKAYPEEKVGVFVRSSGQTKVLEYSDPRFTDEMKEATDADADADGALRFRAGSIAIHIFSRDLIDRLGRGDDPALRLPFARANKKVPTIGDPNPAQPNGVKFEMFVFDALPFAKNPVVIETAREDDFSPVKNDEGVDSPETCRQDQLRQFARWAKAAGQQLPVDETGLPEFEFEISPLFADSEAEFVRKAAEGVKIGPGTVLEP